MFFKISFRPCVRGCLFLSQQTKQEGHEHQELGEMGQSTGGGPVEEDMAQKMGSSSTKGHSGESG